MRRLRRTLAQISIGALLAAAPAAADPVVILQEPPAVAPVHVIALDDGVDGDDARRLTDAARDGRVIALLPADAELDASAAPELALLQSANLDVLVQPYGERDAAAVDAFTQLGARVHRLAGVPCEALCVNDALTALGLSGDEPTTDGTTVRKAIVAPARDGGGITLPAAALAVVLLALAGALTVVLVTRLRTPAEEPAPPVRAQLPPPGAYAGRAQVVSVLDPEGYVEVEGCLRRARWAADGAPPTPGEWVELDRRNGRLWASPPMSRPRSRASA